MFSFVTAKKSAKSILLLLLAGLLLASCGNMQGDEEPVEADYVVEHYKQSSDREGYFFFEEEVLSGTVGEKTEALAKVYEHFTALDFEQKTIKENGSTVVRIFYDRDSEQLFAFTLYPNEGCWPDGSKEAKTLFAGDESGLEDIETAMSSVKNGGYKLAWYRDSELKQEFEGDLALEDTDLYAAWSCYSAEETIEALSKSAKNFYELDVEFNVEGEMSLEQFIIMRRKAMKNSYRAAFDFSRTSGFAEEIDFYFLREESSDSLYYECLRGIALPPTVKKMEGSFFGAYMLEWAVIPESVDEIQAAVFMGCPALTSLVFEDTEHTWSLKDESGNIVESSIRFDDPAANADAFRDVYGIDSGEYMSYTLAKNN